MKKIPNIFLVVSAIAAMLLSACGAVAPVGTSAGSGKPQASLVEFTGVIEAINGNQWTVNGQVITVDPAVIKDGPFNVGDTVKVEADVQMDGSVLITSVETPTVPVANETEDTISTPDPLETPDSTPDPLETPGPTSDGIVFDDSNSEAFGTVDSFSGTSIVIGGKTFTLANGAEIKDTVVAGSFVKVEFILNADGTMSIRQIQLWDPAAVGSGNSNGNDDGPDHDLNDDHGNDSDNDDQNDDHGDDGSGHDQNDDHGGNGGSDD